VHAVRDNAGVSTRPDPAEAERKLAEEAGRRLLAATAYARPETRQAQPIITIAEEPPAAPPAGPASPAKETRPAE
jgi:hypothetical protein